MFDDIYWMSEALTLAKQAASEGEVPVGAVVVLDGSIIGRGFNRPISGCDPSAHAEIEAVRAASKAVNNYRLLNATLYVTLEPCSMCAGAMIHARIGRLVYGASEPKAGVAVSQSAFFEQPWLNHQVSVLGGVMAEECSYILSDFFARRRELKRSVKHANSKA